MWLNLQSAIGLLGIVLLAWLFSEERNRVSYKFIVVGIGLQIIIALMLLKIPWIHQLLMSLNDGVLALQNATDKATAFVFGYLAGGPAPFEITQPQHSFILAFKALPLLIVISALTAILIYWKILPWIVQLFSKGLEKSLGISGSVGLASVANVFVGMVEAPLFVKPWVKTMTRGELFMLMTAGMATIAGTMLVVYASLLANVVPDVAGHLLTASLMSAPAALVMAHIMVPSHYERQSVKLELDSFASSTMDALTQGTQHGLKMFLNIIAMLIVIIALVHLVNMMLGIFPALGGQAISLERLLGYIMAPLVWLMGIPWSEANTAGSLMGAKTVLNEFIAYLQFMQLEEGALSERSKIIMTYALCGFANFGSLGIMIAGLTTIAPERRDDVLSLGVKSIVAGTLATCCTGAVVGVMTVV